MAVQNLECAIAQSQIGRFLANEPISDVALRELKAHIAECDDCRAELARRRAELMERLTGVEDVTAKTPKAFAHAVVSVPEQETPKPRKQKADKLAQGSQAATKRMWIYSIGLAVVLVALSLLMRTSSLFLNGRGVPSDTKLGNSTGTSPLASNGTTNVPVSSNEPQPSSYGAAVKPEVIQERLTLAVDDMGSIANAAVEAFDGNPSIRPATTTISTPSTPPPTNAASNSVRRASLLTRKPAERPLRAKAKPVRRATAKPKSGIRVYDSAGRPVNP